MRDCVFRSIYAARNAEYLVQALTVGGSVAALTPGETERAAQIVTTTTGLTRAWEYWAMRVEKAGGGLSAAKSASRTKPAALAKKSVRKTKSKRR